MRHTLSKKGQRVLDTLQHPTSCRQELQVPTRSPGSPAKTSQVPGLKVALHLCAAGTPRVQGQISMQEAGRKICQGAVCEEMPAPPS